MLRCFAESGGRQLTLSKNGIGPAQPIFAPRPVGAACGDRLELLEMLESYVRVLQMAQRDPACQEFSFDGIGTGAEPVPRCQFLCGRPALFVTAAEQVASHKPPLGPDF